MMTFRKTRTAGAHHHYLSHGRRTVADMDEEIDMTAYSILVSLTGIVAFWGVACLGAGILNSGLLELCGGWLSAIIGS
ncbi:hypothetical protein ACUUL3_02580 [Thiovibrio sp. JS02]